MRKVSSVLLVGAIAVILYLCSIALRNFAEALNAPVAATAATIDSIRARSVNDPQPLERPR
jgi:thiamine pyrophosphate-dependent acetolactate synthase large subunit-like protein